MQRRVVRCPGNRAGDNRSLHCRVFASHAKAAPLCTASPQTQKKARRYLRAFDIAGAATGRTSNRHRPDGRLQLDQCPAVEPLAGMAGALL
ncbi:MAG: hypothetical protein ABI870_14135, partial [Rhodanobacter sp.]